MNDFSPENFTLKQLKAKFDTHVFAIPDIQRSYVWRKDRICKLMDSIFKNYPIGMALIYSLPIAKAVNIRPNSQTIIPPFNKRGATAELIIDGQQRLSTIYGVLHGTHVKDSVTSKINFNELFFDCNKSSEIRFVFNKGYSENPPSGYIRLCELINTSPARLSKQLGLKKWEEEQVVRCYNAFHSYKFHILKFSGFDLEDVREIFIRINSAGMTINKADDLFAKAIDVNLRDHVMETRRGLKGEFKEVPVNAMLNSIALVKGARQLGGSGFKFFLKSVEEEKTTETNFLSAWKRIEYGYHECADFLTSQFHVKNMKELPSENIFSMLSFFFTKNGKRASPYQIKQIKKWFWHTCFAERYSGREFNNNIPADIKFFTALADKKLEVYRIRQKINPFDFLRTDYSKRSQSSVAYFLLLKRLKPLYLHNGNEILLDNANAKANRKDKHHIFPAALLRRNEVNEKWINSVVNICFLESDENKKISDNLPRTYLQQYEAKRHFHRVMKTHLIPVDNQSPIWSKEVKDGFLPFINLRGKLIIDTIEKTACDTLFEPFESIKRI